MEPGFLEKIVGTLLIVNLHTLNVSTVQKDTLFKILNSEIVHHVYDV